MTDSIDSYELNNINDYKFLALAIGDKLRNPNFLPNKREAFLKTLLEQIRPVCSLKSYERIEKSLNEIAHQKDTQEKQQKQKEKEQSNRKQKKLVTAKVSMYDKNGFEIEDYGSDEDEYDDDRYDDDEEEEYKVK